MKKFLSLSIAMLSLTMISSCSQKNENSHSSETFTIYWRDWDNSILQISKNVPYGETPVYTGFEPSRDADAKNTYTFSGWSPEVGPAYKDETYVAQYSESLNTYTVTWQNYNGSVLLTETYKYGDTPTFKGSTPSRPKDAQYTYTFSSWSPNIEIVTQDATYVAQFDNSVNSYAVTWKNYDGSILATETYQYGDTPTYKGENPVRNKDAQYTYSFSGWSPVVASVTGDATYVAQFEGSLNSYTITWKNYDGTVLDTETYKYGQTPTYTGETPINDEYDGGMTCLIFKGNWSPSISQVTGDATYTALFSVVDVLTYENISSTECRVKSVRNKNIVNLVVPAKVGNRNVTEIGDYVFRDCKSLTSVIIPDSVNYIGNDIFDGCSSLQTMTIPFVGNRKGSLGLSATLGRIFSSTSFEGATSTTQYWSDRISVDTRATYYIPNALKTINITGDTELNYGAFNNCVNIEEVNFLGNVKKIHNQAFSGCTSLTSITLPTSLKYIGKNTFYNCGSLHYNEYENGYYLGNQENPYVALIAANGSTFNSFTINTKTKIIYSDVFKDCSDLVTISIPNGITCMGDCCFSGCTQLTSFQTLQNLEYLGESAFKDCASMTEFIIPNLVDNIGDYTFYGCTNLKTTQLPNILKTIGEYAFFGCSSLENVVFPETLVEIGTYAFNGCNSFTSIDLPDGITRIEKSTFSYCGNIDYLHLPNSLLFIDSYAFTACNSLTLLVIPENVQTIKHHAFSLCDNLATIYCVLASKPNDWEEGWNTYDSITSYNVVWGATI